MDLKDALKGLQSQEKTEEPKITIEKTEEPTEDNNLLTFEAFKRLVGSLIFEDKILIQMKLKWYEDATQMIIFQGVRSNVIARLRSNGQHVINRSVFKKRIQDVLEKDMELSTEQKQAKERTKEEPLPQ